MNPKISIVTPSLNQGRYIQGTLESVVLQDYENLEYVVVDGGSTDRTPEILHRFVGHPRVKEIVVGKDKGQTDGLIKGFSRCTGDVFGWLNADDMLAPGALSTIGKLFAEREDIDVVVGNLITINAASEELALWPRRVMSDQDWLRWPQGIGQPATFFSAKAYNAVGGMDPALHYAMDYDLFMRLALAGKRFLFIDQVLAFFRIHPSSKSVAVPLSFWREEIKVYRKNGGRLFSPFWYWKFRGIISTTVRGRIFRSRKW